MCIRDKIGKGLSLLALQTKANPFIRVGRFYLMMNKLIIKVYLHHQKQMKVILFLFQVEQILFLFQVGERLFVLVLIGVKFVPRGMI